jgi:SAM-dependent methyltransferase
VRVQIGSGRVVLPGFVNVDIRPLAETDVVGHAGDLRNIADGSVDLLFSHALFEHVFVRQQLSVLREWRRALAGEGLVVCLGVPDFATIAGLYSRRARGVVGERFDLFNVYRYTHGEPEHATDVAWGSWRPDRHPDSAPTGWLPQLHKGLFDAGYLRALFEAAGLAAIVFNYAYPGEEHALNLGAIAVRADARPRPADPDFVRSSLLEVPEVVRFVRLESLAVDGAPALPEGMLDHASRGTEASPPRSIASGVKRRLIRTFRRRRP